MFVNSMNFKFHQGSELIEMIPVTWTVYILECADTTLYTGITNNMTERLEKHANGTGAKYTRGRGPYKVIYQEECESRSAATRREAAIKALSRARKILLAQQSPR
jgi:predicted GIY-YIG superfamily endonuclease